MKKKNANVVIKKGFELTMTLAPVTASGDAQA